MMRDIVVTWPKSKPLEVYLDELLAAVIAGAEINFRLPTSPRYVPERCYMVHSGYVRGYNLVRSVQWRGPREVLRVASDPLAGYWPAGWYVIRAPEWHPIALIRMQGFQGFRYFERPA